MNYTNVSVNAQGQAPLLTGGTGTTVSLGLNCGNFPAGHFPVVGTSYTINATDPTGKKVLFEGYKCLKAGETSTFSAN